MKQLPPKPHYHVTAGLIWRDGLLLITKRPPGTDLAGFWEFPGGKLEPRETLEACLEREIQEELDLGVRAAGHFMSVRHEYASKRITLHVFHCTYVKGRLRPMEGQEYRWVSPKDLDHASFPPPDRAIIEALKGGRERFGDPMPAAGEDGGMPG